eukprot:68002_1
MTSYGQYNRNQTSDEAADALEQSIFDSDHLYQKYRDELSPLLQEAELRLDEMGLKKFTKIENVIGKHVSRWYQLNKSLCEMSLNFRTHYNHMNVKLDSLKVEIDERDKIIRTQRKDFESDKQQYENQLKVLESALADSIPRNKSSVLDKYNNTEQYQLTQLQKDLNISHQSYEKVKIENKRLSENLKILKSSSDDFQQTLMTLNNEISKKEDEILKLRWLTQDLAAERNGLEQKIQKHTNDPNFTSVTPQRQMQYDVDFSKYIDEDQDELSDDAAENGLLSLEMSDDADINPQVAKKLAEALEAVKKVTQFANDRDSQARQLESDKDLMDGIGVSGSEVKSKHYNYNYNNNSRSSRNKLLIIPNIAQYQQEWLVHKSLVDKLIEQLQITKKECSTIIDIIKPIKRKRNILSELPDTKRINILSIFDRVDDTVQDIEPTSDECIDKFNDLIQFFDILIDEASKYDSKNKVIIDKNDNNIMVDGGGDEQFVDHEAHLLRRQQYAEVIVDLEEYLTDAQKQCQTISGALRNGASEMSKLDDKTEWLSIVTSINRNANTSLTLIHATLEESLKEIKTAGILLMQNDKQIERYQQQLQFLTKSLEKQREKYHDDVEKYCLEIRKEKDKNIYLNEELQHERTITERRSSQVERLEKEIEEYSSRLNLKINGEIINSYQEIINNIPSDSDNNNNIVPDPSP